MSYRRSLGAGFTVALVLGLTSCGSQDNYCEVAQANQAVFVDDGTGLGLISGIEDLKRIAAASPDDLKDEWQVFLTAVSGLRDAIESVGLKPSDFTDGRPPAATPVDDQKKIAAAADRLAQPDVVEAASGIEQQAKDVCKFQLGL